MSLRTKILLTIATVGLLVVAASVAASWYFRYAGTLNEFQQFVRSAAGTTALALDGSDLDAIHSNEDVTSEAFQRVRSILEASRRINHLTEQEIYILRPDPNDFFNTRFVVMLQEKTFVGQTYSVRAANREAFKLAWTTGLPQATKPYTDEHGRWISGYVPVCDAEGRPVAMLEVDAEISRFLQTIFRDLALAAGAGLAALGIAILPGWLLANRITGGLAQLTAGIRSFQAGRTEVTVHLKTGDEIEELGSVFNAMSISLSEKLALLPYVSRFTADAVRRSREDPSWLMGLEQEVTVLFADLRGFTRFSESSEASELVRDLNHLLSIQADVVVSTGGDVDKFIGDAIMAVFLNSEDPGDRVFACAAQLVKRVHEETAVHKWPLGLGVGIHSGRAVMGSIGSKSRRDFTVVGHTVNLASRLCDRAQSWQILVTDSFRERLSPNIAARFAETEPLQFKNVRQFVPTYACQIDLPLSKVP